MKRTTWLAFFLILSIPGCGHPASVQECEEIVERIVRLELKAADASASIADEVRLTKESLRDDMMKRCVGRRITDRAMQCVRSAATAKEIEEQCFD